MIFDSKLQIKRITFKLSIVVWMAIIIITQNSTSVQASSAVQFNQTINPGTLLADIRDAARASITSPTITMTTKSASYNCLNGANGSTSTLGTDSQRLYIDNPGAASNGWTLTIAPTNGTTSTWSNSGGTNKFDFNDATTSGCSDGADTDSQSGQMTIDPSGGALTADCSNCTTSNIAKGSSAAFAQGTLDSLTILTGSSLANNFGRWYVTGINVNQTIPAEQAVDNYSLTMTLTSTAL